MTCASQVKRHREQAEVTVLEHGGHVSYSACGIPGWLGGRIEGGPEALVALDADTAREDRDIDVRTGTTVERIEPDEHRIRVDGTTLAYDELVIATGAAPHDPFDAGDADNVFVFRHLDHGVRAERFLSQTDPETACVVGGGFVGMEIGEALARRGLDVTLLQAEETLVGARFHPELSEVVREHLEAAGVDVRTSTEARSIPRQGEWAEGVRTGDGTFVTADLVVVATGTEPRSGLAAEAGCEISEEGAVLVDRAMRTSVDGILACGDCVAYPHRLTGERVRQPLALHANRGGRIAASTILGEEARFPGILGTAATRIGHLDIALTGLTASEALSAGFEPVTATIEAETKAGYEPGAAPARVHLVAEKGSGRLLGGQIVGGSGAGHRIDTLAAALWKDATAGELEDMDLAYSPLLSPTWDPLAVAARMAAREAEP